MVGQCKGSNPTNPPIFSRTEVNPDMEAMYNTRPMETMAKTLVPIGTKDSIEMTITPILVIAKSS